MVLCVVAGIMNKQACVFVYACSDCYAIFYTLMPQTNQMHNGKVTVYILYPKDSWVEKKKLSLKVLWLILKYKNGWNKNCKSNEKDTTNLWLCEHVHTLTSLDKYSITPQSNVQVDKYPITNNQIYNMLMHFFFYFVLYKKNSKASSVGD